MLQLQDVQRCKPQSVAALTFTDALVFFSTGIILIHMTPSNWCPSLCDFCPTTKCE